MSNLGFELALKDLGIPFSRAQVGDRYVIAQMQEKGWRLGGESSGHIICADSTTTGDGIVAALKVVAAVVNSGRSLRDLKLGMTKFPQTMINVRLNEKINFDENEAVQKAIGQTLNNLEQRGRVLLRPSGTEPVVRVMVEGEEAEQVKREATELADVVRAVVGG